MMRKLFTGFARPLNRGMHGHKIILGKFMPMELGFQEMMYKLFTGIKRLLNKDMHRHNLTLG